MKKYIIAAFMLAMGAVGFLSCESDYEPPVLTEDDYPRIIGKWPEKLGNDLGVMAGTAGVEFSHTMQFTPSNLCTGIWYVDGEEYSIGTMFSYMTETPGEHHLKLVVSTSKYSTSRECILRIRPSK